MESSKLLSPFSELLPKIVFLDQRSWIVALVDDDELSSLGFL